MAKTSNYYATLNKSDEQTNKMNNRLVEALNLLSVNEQLILGNEVLDKISELFGTNNKVNYKEIKAFDKEEILNKIMLFSNDFENIIHKGLILIRGADYKEACELIDSIINNNKEQIRPELAFKSLQNYSSDLSISIWFI